MLIQFDTYFFYRFRFQTLDTDQTPINQPPGNVTMFFFMLQEIDKLGDVITMSHVHVYSENGERKERLFLLFSSQLVMLSVSPRMSGYQYEVTQKIKHISIWILHSGLESVLDTLPNTHGLIPTILYTSSVLLVLCIIRVSSWYRTEYTDA